MLFPSLENAVRVIMLFFSVLSEKGKVVHEAIWNEHFDDDVPNDSCGPNHNTSEMLMSIERDQSEGFSTILDNEQLKEEDSNDDSTEKIIVGNVGEAVELIFFKFTSIEEIENLQKDKNVEEKS